MGRLLSALLLVSLLPAGALADPSCFGLCSVDCVKPISIPDRWDDFSVPGSTNWSGNGVWDQEKFTDTNGNGVYDPGEPFQDGSSAWTKGGAGPLNGHYDSEAYDPLTTGYIAAKDLGSEIVLAMGSPFAIGSKSVYYPLAPPNSLGGDASQRAAWNWANCNPTQVSVGGALPVESGNVKGPTAQALRDIVNQDPGAYWDDACQCVVSSMGNASSRLFIFVAHDPRIPLSAGGQNISVTKLVGFFVESATVNADLKGRFVQIQRTGSNSCANGGDFVVDCAVPTAPVSWGRVKASYR